MVGSSSEIFGLGVLQKSLAFRYGSRHSAPMSDAPIVGDLDGPPEEIDEGSLLYDPEAPIAIEGDDGFEPASGPGIPRALLVGGGVIAISAIVFLGYVSIRAPTPEEAMAELPPLIPTLVGVEDVSEAIVPVPTATPEGPVGSTLRIGVRAAARGGIAMPDTLVRFRIESGDGVLAEEEVRTNVDGIATTSLTLPIRPGATVILAGVGGASIDEARITVTALPGTPERISRVSGNGQTADVGELLPTRLFVFVSDAEGNPVPNAEVRFRVASGEGVTAPSQSRTDSLGQASALWRLGMEDGEQRLTASSTAFSGVVTFRATGRPRATPLSNQPGPIETGPVTVVLQTFSVGGSHVCALEGGMLNCRGGNDRRQTSTRGPTRFVAITAGVSHVCGLTEEGIASCWGANEGGQLGGGTGADRPAPSPVRTELRFASLTAGSAHTCGLAGGGVPICWGQNLSGQLGDGSRNDHSVPRTVGGGLGFSRLTAGWNHTCGLTSNGNAFCWGLNSHGQLGDGSRLDRLVPTLVRGAVETLVAGSSHTCGISEEQVLCWGGNSFGQLGDGSAEDRSHPVQVQGLPAAPTHLSAGAVHACALVAGGQAYCWGQNLQGQLGDGTTQNRASAVAVRGGLRFTEIHAGGAQTCGMTEDGTQYCWGLNRSGQLGDGTRVSRSTPTLVGS